MDAGLLISGARRAGVDCHLSEEVAQRFRLPVRCPPKLLLQSAFFILVFHLPYITRVLPQPTSYEAGLSMQEDCVSSILKGSGGDTLFLLEHEPVYTIGRLRDQSSLRSAASLPHPVFETNRGGQATYHGPGQLVGYLIFDLNQRGRDLHLHLRLIEDALISACEELGVMAARREGLTGVWAENRKIASIGVGVKKWISMHGFAINVTPESLPPFLAITPCGLDGVSMTCLAAEAQKPVTMESATSAIARQMEKVFGAQA